MATQMTIDRAATQRHEKERVKADPRRPLASPRQPTRAEAMTRINYRRERKPTMISPSRHFHSKRTFRQDSFNLVPDCPTKYQTAL